MESNRNVETREPNAGTIVQELYMRYLNKWRRILIPILQQFRDIGPKVSTTSSVTQQLAFGWPPHAVGANHYVLGLEHLGLRSRYIHRVCSPRMMLFESNRLLYTPGESTSQHL